MDKVSKNDLDLKLSIDGSNLMFVNLDMDSNKVINLFEGIDVNDVVIKS